MTTPEALSYVSRPLAKVGTSPRGLPPRGDVEISRFLQSETGEDDGQGASAGALQKWERPKVPPNPEISEYKVFMAYSRGQAEHIISRAMKAGWKLHGDSQVVQFPDKPLAIWQPMVR